MQISIQIYAFDFDVSNENVFNFLKIILHLYCLVEQMRSLCQDDVNICNAFSIFFSSLLSLTSVILHYCDAVAN